MTPETAAAMHSSVASTPVEAQVQCEACQTPYTPRKPWQRHCSPKCRRAWHAWTRPGAVREARELVRMVLDQELLHLTLDGWPDHLAAWEARARKLLGIK